MSKIQRLSETTINQIAAGEVIESSASVVKELVENALDAGATHISVETHAGGQGLIRVSDNGCGMDEEDLLLALERHATSKIAHVDDLLALQTLGFRGEALPSIASISKMTLHTCADKGITLTIEGGRRGEIRPAPRQQGTTIEVRHLFYNVPVRQKFQKSPSADSAAVRHVLTQIALCHPEVELTWKTEYGEVFSLRGPDRLEALLGESFVQDLLPLALDGECAVEGWIGKPHCHRPNRRGQSLFLNGRPVHVPLISSAVQEGYGPRLPSGRFPVFVLHLQAPTDWVDVNVHPQKKEVRLRHEAQMRSAVTAAVEAALQKRQAPALPSLRLPEVPSTTVAEEPVVYQPAVEAPQPCVKIPGRVLATVGPYAFIEQQALYLLDVRAARARIWHERLQEEAMPLQTLLLPLSEEFSPADATELSTHLERLEEFLGIRYLGGTTFVIDAIPQILSPEDVRPWLEGLLAGKSWERRLLVLKLCERVPGGAHSPEQLLAIFEQLHKCTQPERCPLGRVTYRELTEKELRGWMV